jgi:hypothetical protein
MKFSGATGVNDLAEVQIHSGHQYRSGQGYRNNAAHVTEREAATAWDHGRRSTHHHRDAHLRSAGELHQGNTAMTSKITLAASAILVALSSAAVASTANVPPRHHAAQASPQAFDFAAPTSAAEPNAYQYHGGPKSNSTTEVE